MFQLYDKAYLGNDGMFKLYAQYTTFEALSRLRLSISDYALSIRNDNYNRNSYIRANLIA